MHPSPETKQGLTRRQFLRSSVQAAAIATAVTAFPYVSRSRVLGANDRIGIGFIGVGSRGNTHLATLQQLIAAGEKAQMIAVNDAYGYRLEEAAKATGAKPYRKHHDLLDDAGVDVVCIATPDRLHMPQALDAIRAGKDVYCEKPMGHWSQFELTKQFCLETRKLRRVVQIGNQGNSSPIWQQVTEIIQKGTIGRVQHIQAGFYRNGDSGERMDIPDREATPGPDLDWEAFLGDAPKVPFTVERFFSWRRYLDYAGGPCTDLFPHVLTPFLHALRLGYPSLAAGTGGIFKFTTYDREVPDTFNLSVDYPQKLSISVTGTLSNDTPTDPAIRGDEGTLTFQTATDWTSGFDSVTLQSRKNGKSVIAAKRVEALPAHWQNFLSCVRSRHDPATFVELGCNVHAALSMAMLSYLKKKVALCTPAGEVSCS